MTNKLDENLISNDSLWCDLVYKNDKIFFIFYLHNFKDTEKFQDEIDSLKRTVNALIDPYIRLDLLNHIF
jgi:alpha-glucosidase (family GH31 glycosyl hydrolase)